MSRLIIIYLILFSVLPVYTQENLVPNADFDTEVNCGNGPATIAHWFIPNPKEIDLNHLCPYIDWWRFIRDKKYGYKGTQCGYIETFYKGFADDNIYSGRIYIAVKLLKPLTAGVQYYFEMKVRAVDTFPNFKLVNTVFTNGQDVAFVKDQPTFDYDIPRNYLQLRPTIVSKIQADYEWHTLSVCFTAEGHEQYMIIGNFRNDANTEVFTTGKKNPNFTNGLIANYAIDDVVLVPTAVTLNDTAICQDESLQITLDKKLPASLQLRWSDGSSNHTFVTGQSGTHSVILHYGSACSLTETFKVRILPQSFTTKIIDTTYCIGKSITLSAGFGAGNERVKWTTGSTNKEIEIFKPGNYSAHIKNRCTEYKQEYTVRETSCEDGVYVPNVFMIQPGNEFKPLFAQDYTAISNYRMMVFDRWGNTVFTTNNKDRGWNGLSDQRASYQGVYLYLISYETMGPRAQKHQYKGDVTVMVR